MGVYLAAAAAKQESDLELSKYLRKSFIADYQEKTWQSKHQGCL